MSTDNRAGTNDVPRKLSMAYAMVILSLVSLSLIGGLPPREKMTAFGIGLIVFLVGMAGFATLIWFWLLKPLPQNQIQSTSVISRKFRYLLSIVLANNIILCAVGSAWDGAWHTAFFIPFGPDFFWRPHLITYFGLLSSSALAYISFLYSIKHSQGSLTQRMRAEPAIGLFVSAACLMLYTLPLDPFWHTIYGNDITPWSLPHFAVWSAYMILLLSAMLILLSTQPPTRWDLIWRTPTTPIVDIAILLLLAIASLVGWQILTGFVYTIQRISFQILLPAIVIAYATFVGLLGIHFTRRAGAATLVGLFSLAIWVGFMQIFGWYSRLDHSLVAALLPLLALDLSYAYSIQSRQGPPSWLSTGLVTAASGIPVIFLVTQIFLQRPFSIKFFIVTTGVCSVTAVITAWQIQLLAEYLSTTSRSSTETPVMSARLRWLPILSFAATAIFLWYFIGTATAPVRSF